MTVNFLVLKTRTAPLTTLSIPRLELLRCLLLSKLFEEVLNGLMGCIVVDEIFCWTHSQVALSWIWGKEKQCEAWVKNRVVSIRKVVDRTKWHFVKGDENPADIPTRMASNLPECFSSGWCRTTPCGF